MSLINLVLILTGVLLNALAQLSLKAGTNALGQLNFSRAAVISTILKIGLEPYIIAGLFLYVFSFAIWIVALSKVPVSIAYPMLSIGYVINAAAACYLFGEDLSIQKITGIAVIMLGVFLVVRSQ